jgi:hypothetical protein
MSSTPLTMMTMSSADDPALTTLYGTKECSSLFIPPLSQQLSTPAHHGEL